MVTKIASEMKEFLATKSISSQPSGVPLLQRDLTTHRCKEIKCTQIAIEQQAFEHVDRLVAQRKVKEDENKEEEDQDDDLQRTKFVFFRFFCISTFS